MALYEFTIHVIGEGETPELAWEDAQVQLAEAEWRHMPDEYKEV